MNFKLKSVLLLFLGVLSFSMTCAQVTDEEPVDQNLQPEFIDIDDSTFRLDINNPPHSDFELAGIDDVSNAILGTVSRNLSAEEISQQLQTLRATMNISLTRSTMELPLSKLESGMILFAEASLDPLFTKKRVETEKETLISNIEFIRKDPEEIADNVSVRLAYGYEHPYGERAKITTIRAINENNTFLHYQANVTVKNAVLTVEGNITADQVKPFLIDTFSPWVPSEPLLDIMVETENVQYSQLNIVDIRGLDKSQVRIVNTTALNMLSEDYYSSRIATLVLDKYLKTLPFSAGASLTIEDEVSLFSIKAETATKETATGIMDILSAVQRIRTVPITEAELTEAKTQILEDYSSEFLIDERIEVLRQLDSVVPNDVRVAAVKHIKYNQFRVIAVCDARAIYDTFKFIKIRNKKAPERFYNRAGDRLETMPSFDRPLPEGATTASVFNKYIEAIGGVEITTAIETLYIDMTSNVNETRLQLELRKTIDGRYQTALSIEGNLMSKLSVYGDTGYVIKNNQRAALDSIQVFDSKLKGVPFLELFPENAQLIRIEGIDERDFLVVDFNGISEEYYDIETGLKTMSIVKKKDVDIPIEIKYSNYKRVEGILYPSKIIQNIGGTDVVFEVREIVINPVFEPEDFE